MCVWAQHVHSNARIQLATKKKTHTRSKSEKKTASSFRLFFALSFVFFGITIRKLTSKKERVKQISSSLLNIMNIEYVYSIGQYIITCLRVWQYVPTSFIRSFEKYSFRLEMFTRNDNNLYCIFFPALRSNLIHFVTSTLQNKLKGE